MALVAYSGRPVERMALDIGPLAPVPDRLKYAPSDGALHLDYLRALAEELEAPPSWKKLPPDYDRQCYDVAFALRFHGSYLIQVGVR